VSITAARVEDIEEVARALTLNEKFEKLYPRFPAPFSADGKLDF